MRLTAGGAGVGEGGRGGRGRRRRAVEGAAYGCPARGVSMPASHQYQCLPMSQVTHAEGQQGAVQIGKMVCLSTTRARSEGLSSYMQDSKVAKALSY